MKKLYAEWGDRVQFVDVVVRQAHPGPKEPPYRTFDQKMQDARAYKDEEGIPWSVVVDDLEGAVHQVYGNLADPTYLIDTDGRVAFYNMWTHAPTLHKALEALMEKGGRGVVEGGIDRMIHMAAPMTHGWRGLRRGLPQSLIDIETAGPTTGVGVWAGYQLRPLLAPLTLRSRPLPAPVKLALAAGVAAVIFGQVRRRVEDSDSPRR